MDKSYITKKLLETFFLVVYFIALMELMDYLLIAFVCEITVQNILTIPLAFISLVLSAWLSERTVQKIKEYL